MHKVHATDPVVVLYLPAAQAEHGPPSAPVCPTLHTQALAAVLCDGDVEKAGQFSHRPNKSLKYSFSEHPISTHCPAFPAMNPALHTQDVLCAAEFEYGRQLAQTSPDS